MRTLFILGCIVFAGGGNLLLKSGMQAVGNPEQSGLGPLQFYLSAFTKPIILIALVLYVVSMLLWLRLLSMMDISVVYPIFVSAAFLLVMAGSVIWFGEHVNLMRVLGTLVVAAGIFIVSMSK